MLRRKPLLMGRLFLCSGWLCVDERTPAGCEQAVVKLPPDSVSLLTHEAELLQEQPLLMSEDCSGAQH